MMNLPPEYERAQREYEELVAERERLTKRVNYMNDFWENTVAPRVEPEAQEAFRNGQWGLLHIDVFHEKADPHAGYDTLRADFERMKLQRDEAKKHCEEFAYERDEARADLAQMKSTLSDTQQKLRAVQEDRDEFAAKMNDAVERADQLQARCGDLESILKERDSEKISLLQQICQLKAECGDMEKERDEAAEKIKDFENLKRRIEGMMEAFQLIVKGSGIGGD